MLKHARWGERINRRNAWGRIKGDRRASESVPVKPREERQKVMIKARMHSGVAWHDVCILNLSVHGVGIQAAEPPERGTYVEIRRGSQVIVARVAWSKGHRAGLRSQDAIFINAIVNDVGTASAAPRMMGGQPVERRVQPRVTHQQRHDHSRLVGRAMEFACFAIAAGAVAMTAFGTVEEALARPLSQIGAALGSD